MIRDASADAAFAVVIPARDERAVLGETLHALRGQRAARRLEVVVVATNCQDDTAEVSRRFAGGFAAAGHRLVTVETPADGKPAALDAGDDLLRSRGEPLVGVMYLDADAVLSETAVEACARAIDEGVDLVAPAVVFRSPRGPIAKRYLRVYQSLPQVRDGTACRGCYAVSARGRERWKRFPADLPDDAFVRTRFRSDETRVVAEACSTVPFPEDEFLAGVVGRWAAGNLALRAAVADRPAHGPATRLVSLRAIATTPSAWLAVPTFLRVRRQARRRPGDDWAPGR